MPESCSNQRRTAQQNRPQDRNHVLATDYSRFSFTIFISICICRISTFVFEFGDLHQANHLLSRTGTLALFFVFLSQFCICILTLRRGGSFKVGWLKKKCEWWLISYWGELGKTITPSFQTQSYHFSNY